MKIFRSERDALKFPMKIRQERNITRNQSEISRGRIEVLGRQEELTQAGGINQHLNGCRLASVYFMYILVLIMS